MGVLKAVVEGPVGVGVVFDFDFRLARGRGVVVLRLGGGLGRDPGEGVPAAGVGPG